MFRVVKLPEWLTGHLFLHSMPGRYEAYEDARQEIARCHISRVVCLAPLAEVKIKSPLYAQAIEAARPSWKQEMFPVADYGIPEDRETFWRLAQRLGTLAICLALGVTADDARAAV